MFQQNELDIIMKEFDIDLESAKYYKRHGDLPEAILRDRITSYIDQYVSNPNCPIPLGISIDFAHYIQLYIDQYPNLSEDLKMKEVPSFVHGIMEEALTDRRLQIYSNSRFLAFDKAQDFKKSVLKTIKEEMKKDDFSIDKLIGLFENTLKEKDSPKTVAILSAYYDLLSALMKKEILERHDFQVVEEQFYKYQNNITFYPDYYNLNISNQIFKEHFVFLDQIEELGNSMQKLNQLYEKNVKKAPYKEKIDNITFASQSKTGLKELITYYKGFVDNAKTVNQKYFLDFIGNKDLFITNIEPPNVWSDDSYGPCYMKDSKIIYLDKKALDHYFGGVLYHEAEHFVYALANKEENDTIKKEIMDILLSLRKKVTRDDNKRFLVDYQNDLENWKKYAETFKDEAIDVLRGDLKNEGEYPSDDLLEERFSQYTYDLANAKMYQSGYNSIFDIFDAIHKGEFSTAFSDYKVGHKDSFSNDDVCCNEIMAEIAVLYNYGNIDMLVQYLPYEEVLKLIHIYENSVKLNPTKNNITNYRGSLKTLIDYELEHMEQMSAKDLASYTTYEVAGHYLEEAMKEYGEKEFIDLLIDYQMNGDLKIFKDEKIKRYISLLDDSHISMFLQGNMTEAYHQKNI